MTLFFKWIYYLIEHPEKQSQLAFGILLFSCLIFLLGMAAFVIGYFHLSSTLFAH